MGMDTVRPLVIFAQNMSEVYDLVLLCATVGSKTVELKEGWISYGKLELPVTLQKIPFWYIFYVISTQK